MKKINNILCFILVSCLLICSSCTDWLGLSPTDGVPRDDYWKTKEDVNAVVVGAYSSLLNGNLVARMFLYGEWRADMITNGARYTNAYVMRAIEGELAEDNTFCDWSSFYNTINVCNTILKYAPNAQANDASFTDKQLKEYESEAIAIRSLMYFYLVRSFGDVPYIEDAYVDTSQDMNVPKTSKEEILKKLITDLQYAEKNIAYTYGSNDRDKGKMTIWAVKALLADVHLWMENYEECNRLCDEIIKSGKFAFVPVGREEVVLETPIGEETIYYPNEADVSNLFDAMYYQGNCIESIFELQYNTDVLNPFWSMMSISRGYMAPNLSILMDEIFIPTGKSDPNYLDIRESVATSKGYIWKYTGRERGGAERSETEMTANYIIYRLAEIYLMKAEALTQMGIKAGSQDYLVQARESLEKVRVRANAVESTDLTYNETEYDGKTMEEFVLMERARELAYEGKRWFDVLRQAKRNDYEGLDYLMRLAVSSAPPEKVFSLQTKYKNYNSHYLPIYKTELEANPALIQNEFYNTSN